MRTAGPGRRVTLWCIVSQRPPPSRIRDTPRVGAPRRRSSHHQPSKRSSKAPRTSRGRSSSTDGTLAISCHVCSSAYSAVAVSRERYASNCLPHATEVRRSRSGPRRPDRRRLNRSPAAATCSREGRRNQGGTRQARPVASPATARHKRQGASEDGAALAVTGPWECLRASRRR